MTARTARLRSHRRGRGLGLVDVALGLAVLGLIAPMLTRIQVDAWQQAQARATGQRLASLYTAAVEYGRIYRAELAGVLAGGGEAVVYPGRRWAPAAGDDCPLSGDPPSSSPTLPSLRAAGLVPSCYVDATAWGHWHEIRFVQAPAPHGVEVMVGQRGGRDVPDRLLGVVAGEVGQAGGFTLHTGLPHQPAGTANGYGGGWIVSP